MLADVIRSDFFTTRPFRTVVDGSPEPLKRGYMATTTTPQSRESHKKLKPKPKTESKSWQTRNMARKEKQAAHAAKAAETGH